MTFGLKPYGNVTYPRPHGDAQPPGQRGKPVSSFELRVPRRENTDLDCKKPCRGHGFSILALALKPMVQAYCGGFFLNNPVTLLTGFCPAPGMPLPLSAPFNMPVAIPFTSGRNFGSEVVPETVIGTEPIPPIAAFSLNASSFEGLTVPAPVTTPMEGTVRLILSARVPSGATRTSELKF